MIAQVMPSILVLWLLASCSSQGALLTVSNSLDFARNEIISIDRSELMGVLACDEPIQILEPGNKQVLPIQFLDLDQDQEWESILTQIQIGPSESQELRILNTPKEQVGIEKKVFGRLVPERKDDFAWENDRIAFRMYGPALEATGEISSGIDVWVKSVEYPIVNKWYATEDYHKDHGEGADFYKVGPTLGAGGLGLLLNDTLYTSKNFTDSRILAAGPLQFIFELDYAAWGPDSIIISETKRFTLDAGQHFNRVESTVNLARGLPGNASFVTGLVSHPSPSLNPVSLNSSDDYMILYEEFAGGNGALGTAIIRSFTPQQERIKKYGNQYLMVLPFDDPKSVSYYAGAGWTKSPWIDDEADWLEMVRTFIQSKNNPLKIERTN
ncbi:MAG: DUF4861 family protein [Candidatus Marinimicrobia bacterium]|nr:DUF4861 family protein [Candidatus Neomarinimicrobiota bacterium]